MPSDLISYCYSKMFQNDRTCQVKNSLGTWVKHKLRKTSFRSKNTEYTPGEFERVQWNYIFSNQNCLNVHLKLVLSIQSHTEITIFGKNCWKISFFLQMCLINVVKLFLCLQMNSADHCGHFEVCIVAIVVHPIYRVTIMIYDSWVMNHARWSIRKKLQIVCRGWGRFWRVYIMCIVN